MLLKIITSIIFRKAVTEESTSVKADREARAWIETRARWQLVEVPFRVAQVKAGYPVQ
jgi:hypothetical protein